MNRIEKKLHKLIQLLQIESTKDSIDIINVKRIYIKYQNTKSITKENMLYCNRMWEKYYMIAPYLPIVKLPKRIKRCWPECTLNHND